MDINLFSFTQSLDKNRTKKQLTPTLPNRHAVGVAMSSFGILFNFCLLSGFRSLTFPQGPLEQGGVTTFEWTKKLRDLSINFKS
jgi:hypothetical protein